MLFRKKLLKKLEIQEGPARCCLIINTDIGDGVYEFYLNYEREVLADYVKEVILTKQPFFEIDSPVGSFIFPARVLYSSIIIVTPEDDVFEEKDPKKRKITGKVVPFKEL